MIQLLFALSFFFVIAPIMTLLHEAGHALIPLLSQEPVRVFVGCVQGTGLKVANLEIGYCSPWTPWVGYTTWGGVSGVLHSLLGPIFSFLIASLFLLIRSRLRNRNQRSLLLACAGWAFFQFVFTVLPLNYLPMFGYPAGTASDGKIALELIRAQHP